MTSQIDPAFKAAYRETQGQPVDAEPRAWDGYAHAVASSSELAGTEWETNDQPVGAVARRPIVAAQQDGGPDLIERLESYIPETYEQEGDGYYDTPFTFVLREAATALAEKDARIAELEAERDEARAEAKEQKRLKNELVLKAYPAMDNLDDLRSQLTASRAECEGLRAALEPFAAEADEWSDDVSDGYHPGVTEPGYSQAHASAKFSLGDLRAARAALSQKETGDE